MYWTASFVWFVVAYLSCFSLPLLSTYLYKTIIHITLLFQHLQTNPCRCLSELQKFAMLVQLSPWEVTQTSILVPRGTLRRSTRRNNGAKDDGLNNNNNTVPPQFTASFITTASKTSLRKMRFHSSELSDCLPVLAVTSEHRITAVGNKLQHLQQQKQKQSTEDLQQKPQHKHQHQSASTSQYREYRGCLQYNSRPGGAGSFFSKPTNGVDDQNPLPTIPAILDTKNDRVYAVQHGNSRLCCWNSWKDTGPDQKSTLRVELSSPILSMSLLPMHKGMVYGTCLNGNVFVATVIIEETSKNTSAGDSILVVKYIPTRQPKETIHIGTLAVLPEVAQQTRSTGRKRKMSDADGNLPVIFYQAFCDGVALKIIRHEILFQGVSSGGSNPNEVFKPETLVQRITWLDLIRTIDRSNPSYGLFLTRSELLVSSSGTAPKVSIVFTVGSRSTSTMKNDEGGLNDRLGTYGAVLSLDSASLVFNPVRLPSRAVQFGLVTETYVAAATNNEISLFDLATGSVLQTKAMNRLVRDGENDWVLRTDTKNATVAVLYSKDEQLMVAFSTAKVNDSRINLAVESLTASSKLACSLLASSKRPDEPSLEDSVCALGMIDFARKGTTMSMTKLDSAVERMLAILAQTGKRIRQVNSHDDISFLKVFQSCVSTLVKDIDSKNEAMENKDPNTAQVSKAGYETSHRNPQDSANDFSDTTGTSLQSPKTVITMLGGEKQQLNGYHHTPTTARTIAIDVKLPACLPQSFIDGALEITLNAIRDRPKLEKGQYTMSIPSMETRLVLRTLLLSGRVSARGHLEGSYVLQESKNKHPLIVALRSLQIPKGCIAYSPVDFVHDLLQHCSDLSEYQLVILLDYMLRRATAHDIAESFSRMIGMPGQHKELSRRYFNARDMRDRMIGPNDADDAKKSLSNELKNVSTTILLSGVTVALQKILYYSECNEAMLREALRECLSSAKEVALLARLLSDMLLSPPLKIGPQYNRHKNMTLALCQWVSGLCESRRDDLVVARTSSGETYLSVLVSSVSRVTRNTMAAMSLKGDIGYAHTKRRKMEREVRNLAIIDSKTAHFAEQDIKEEDIPGYSIEKIMF
jgi:hypothetical protein